MTNQNSNLWTGALIGLIVSLATSVATIWIQHSYTRKEKEIQMYLDEKKDFVAACEDYLKQYREWHELMNYYIYKNDTVGNHFSEYQTNQEAIKSYRTWTKNFDYAYGKIFLLSDNSFGSTTMEVSTVLHAILKGVMISDSLDRNLKILREIDSYFVNNWLLPAQEEIFRYNNGERIQITAKEFIEKRKELLKEKHLNDSIDNEMNKQIQMLNEFIKPEDSISDIMRKVKEQKIKK